MNNIFFFEAFEEERKALISFGAEDLKADFSWKTIQEADFSQPPAPIISVRTQSAIPVEWAPKLKAILTRSTGFDHLTRYRIAANCPNLPCGYLPLYCNRTVAEQALTLWMALARKLPTQIKQFKTFHRDGLTGTEIKHKNLLVIGVGRIGTEIVKIGRGLGMEVQGIDPIRRLDDLEYVSYEEGAPWADIIAVSMSLNPENHGYFTRERLSLVKPGALLVNVARGEFTPLENIVFAMKAGFLGGVGLDVYDSETALGPQLRSHSTHSRPDDSPLAYLLNADNAILTPHNAFNTHEAVLRKSQQSVQQTRHFLDTGTFIWNIDE